MEQYSIQSRYYPNVVLNICDPFGSLVTQMLNLILDECKDKTICSWYKMWHVKEVWYSVVATIDQKPFSIASAKKDGKVLCYLYTLEKYRKSFRDLVQTDYTQIFIDNAITDSIYLGIDTFTKKHKSVAKAMDRVIMNGGIPDRYTPYKGKWTYSGVTQHKGVDQHIYKLDVNRLKDKR